MTDRDSTSLALALALQLEAMQQVGHTLDTFRKNQEKKDGEYALRLDQQLNGGGSAAGCGGSSGAVCDSIPTSLTRARQMWQLHTDAELARKIAQEQTDSEVAGRGGGAGAMWTKDWRQKFAQEEADYKLAIQLLADDNGGRGGSADGRGRGGGGAGGRGGAGHRGGGGGRGDEIVDPNILALRRLPL